MTRSDDLLLHQDTLYRSKNPTRRWLHQRRRAWILSALRRHAGANRARAAEVGPGSGVYLPILAELYDEFLALDIEPAYLHRAEQIAKQHANIIVVQDDITRSHLASASLDFILCTEVLEHLQNSAGALSEMHRLLKPGGILLLTTPQRWSTVETVARVALAPGFIQLTRLLYGEPVEPMGHINLMTSLEVKEQFLGAGFEEIEEMVSGLYLPGLAELLGDIAVRMEEYLEGKIRISPFKGLLWTQGYVLRA